MTTTWEVSFTEALGQERAESVPLSHLSIELGHLHNEEFAAGEDALDRHFARVAPWARAARRRYTDAEPPARPRISTCYLIDDYFTRFSSPAVVLARLVAAAERHGLVIDYVARESACARVGDVPLAALVLDRLVEDPEPGTTGIRPPMSESGWLCNGQRSRNTAHDPAMTPNRGWRPPAENGAINHSVFVDIELWDEQQGERRWSCSFLAAVWQLLRLGLLRHRGTAIAVPEEVDAFPDDWDRLPPVVRLNPRATPFSAYRTFSVLAPRFLPVEHAVRTVLQQFAVERAVADQIDARAHAENIDLGDELWQRIEYLFTGD